MKGILLVLICLFQMAAIGQVSKKTYLLRCQEKDCNTLVFEMDLCSDSTFVNRKYTKRNTDSPRDYKKWNVEVRQVTFKKEKGLFLRLTQIGGDQSLQGKL